MGMEAKPCAMPQEATAAGNGLVGWGCLYQHHLYGVWAPPWGGSGALPPAETPEMLSNGVGTSWSFMNCGTDSNIMSTSPPAPTRHRGANTQPSNLPVFCTGVRAPHPGGHSVAEPWALGGRTLGTGWLIKVPPQTDGITLPG